MGNEMTKRQCSKEHLAAFVAAYPRALDVDIYRISEPPIATWNDFTLGAWPASVVCMQVLRSDRGEPDDYFICVDTPTENPPGKEPDGRRV